MVTRLERTKDYEKNRKRATCDSNCCERCGKTIKPGKAVWLRLNVHGFICTGEDANLSEKEDQGFFPFGPDCAKRF